MNDDELIDRMRAALDEAHEAPALPVALAGAPRRRTWALAAAAALVVVAIGVAALAVRRHDDVTAPSGSTDATGTTVADSGPETSGLPSGVAEWYALTDPSLVAGEVQFDRCCKPWPAPGPDMVIAWAKSTGIPDGVLLLRVHGSLTGGEPTLDYTHFGIDDAEAARLAASVVPGSGLPYVLPEPGWEFLASGMINDGNLIAQEYTSEEASGSVTVSVGDYRGQLIPLGDATSIRSPRSIDGRTAYEFDSQGKVWLVWQTASGAWATVDVAGGLVDRADKIFASIVAADVPGEPTPSTSPTGTNDVTPGTPDSGPTVDWGITSVMRANVNMIIDSGNGPMLAFNVLTSLPPQGGDVRLEGFDWSMVEGEQTQGGVTWVEGTFGVRGIFKDGAFVLSDPPGAPYTFTDDVLTYGTPTADCSDARVQQMLGALQTLDRTSLGLLGWGDYRWDGHCGVFVTALVDTPTLHEALAKVGDDVMVEVMFHRETT